MGALHIYTFDIYRDEHAFLSQNTYAATKDNLLVDTLTTATTIWEHGVPNS